MTGSCHCGAVRVTLARRPAYVNDCNCSLCMKAGALWGYFARGELSVEGHIRTYVRADLSDPAVRLHFCSGCGTVTHWTPVNDALDRVGANMRIFAPAEIAGLEVRYPDGRAWDGDSEWTYRRDPETLT